MELVSLDSATHSWLGVMAQVGLLLPPGTLEVFESVAPAAISMVRKTRESRETILRCLDQRTSESPELVMVPAGMSYCD